MSLRSNLSFVQKLITRKAFRDAYVYEHVRNGIPFQIRTMREQRDWTQGDLGEKAGKPRNVITRLEDPNYGKLTLKTLFEIASAFDVALLVKFVPFTRLVREYEDVSTSALSTASISSEVRQLTAWARGKDRTEAGSLPNEETQIYKSVGPESRFLMYEGAKSHQMTFAFERRIEAVASGRAEMVTREHTFTPATVAGGDSHSVAVDSRATG